VAIDMTHGCGTGGIYQTGEPLPFGNPLVTRKKRDDGRGRIECVYFKYFCWLVVGGTGLEPVTPAM